jgi:hypothetical protein
MFGKTSCSMLWKYKDGTNDGSLCNDGFHHPIDKPIEIKCNTDMSKTLDDEDFVKLFLFLHFVVLTIFNNNNNGQGGF